MIIKNRVYESLAIKWWWYVTFTSVVYKGYLCWSHTWKGFWRQSKQTPSHLSYSMFFLAMGRDWVACEIFRHLTAGRASEAGLPVDEDYSLCLWDLPECSASNGNPNIVSHQQAKDNRKAADLSVLWGVIKIKSTSTCLEA